jgi:hypothetical protein
MSTPASPCRGRCSTRCWRQNFQSGMQTLRQIEFSLFDMLLHTAHDAGADIMPLLQQVRSEVAVLQPPALGAHGAYLQPHFCRWLCCGLLQLQVGRGAQRRCLRRV